MDEYTAVAGGAAGGAVASIIAMFKYIGHRLDKKADIDSCLERHKRIDDVLKAHTDSYCAMITTLNETKIAIARIESKIETLMGRNV